MPRKLIGGLIQCSNPINDESQPVEKVKQAMLDKHVPLIEEAGRKGVQVLCLQEIFNGPYFCPGQDRRWYAAAESVPGPTTDFVAGIAKQHRMAVIVPVYEQEMPGVLYNTAAVYDADGTYLGKYRKNHIPHTSGFWEKYFFKPGNLGYPVFTTRYAKVGVYICYDRHFPEGARALGLNGAEIVFNPSATVAGLSQYLWRLEQPAHAVANGYFLGAINRVGTEAPWNIGKFYGSSYFVDPRGNFLAQAGEDEDGFPRRPQIDRDRIGIAGRTQPIEDRASDVLLLPAALTARDAQPDRSAGAPLDESAEHQRREPDRVRGIAVDRRDHQRSSVRMSYVSGRRSRKNCHVRRTSSIMSMSSSPTISSSLSSLPTATKPPRGSTKYELP